jgi:pilus assembly protein CpaF
MMTDLRKKIFSSLIRDIEDHSFDSLSFNDKTDLIRRLTSRVIDDERIILTDGERSELVDGMLNEILGLGPIQPLLEDSQVSEIMVNGSRNIFYEVNGKIKRSDLHFFDDEHLMRVIEKIILPLGLRVDGASPMTDGRLPDGSRVNVILPPLCLNGPALTIRKFFLKSLSPADLMNIGSICKEALDIIRSHVIYKSNIIISGGASSGKTTLLNSISSFINDHERVITIEDSAELRLLSKHVISLESRPANVEDRGEVTIRDLVRNALRMRPDRLIIGEVRGGECLDLLQALNTGHKGSLATVHANSPGELIFRLETMALMSDVNLPSRAIRQQISTAIDLIVHLKRLNNGRRVVSEISEVSGMSGDDVNVEPIYTNAEIGYANPKIA